MGDQVGWGSGESRVAITVDVEWAHHAVVADIRKCLDERRVTATFFCTHEGIEVPGHARALHPNFRREGNSLLDVKSVAETLDAPEPTFFEAVTRACQAFCPEAVGVRSHSLFYDSRLLTVYAQAGLQYDSSVFLPLAASIQPVWKSRGILEVPIYYMDFWHLSERLGAFDVASLHLDTPGLKVLDFHPNLVYLNASTMEEYTASRSSYHDPDQLRRQRSPSRGVRDLFLQVLDELAERDVLCTLEEINARCRHTGAAPAWPVVGRGGLS